MKKIIESETAADLVEELQVTYIKASHTKAKLDFERLMRIAETAVIGHSEFRQAPSGKMNFADVIALLNDDSFKTLGPQSARGDL